MTIEKKAFRKYDLEDNKQDVVAVKFNKEERILLNQIKLQLQNTKDSQVLKQCLDIASKVLLEGKTQMILHHAINNYRRSVRTGTISHEEKIYKINS